MKVRYTRRAFGQLSDVLDYIDGRSPQGAENVKRQIQAAYPQAGRTTNRVGFRRILAHPYPYAILYKQTKTAIVIHGVRHGARRPRG